jgi:prolyl-tRNA editing enzyme YbaK/EbsC (Cys-tRNA(Pro) deacylase)
MAADVGADPGGAVVAHLDQLGEPYEVVPCDPDLADTAAFCAAYGYSPDASANTIIVVGKGETPSYAACVVLATTRLDVNKVVRRRLGARKASFASADETRELTGMLIGGVTAFALPPGMPLWIDARVMERDQVILGGGSRSAKVLVAPAVLLRVPNAEVVEGLATPAPA